MHFLTLLPLLALSTALPQLHPRQTPSPANSTLIYQLPGTSPWIETLTIRSNGQILLNRLDIPEIWGLDPTTTPATGSKIISLPSALGLTGITEISTDVFAVVAGNFSVSTFATGAGSWALYKVDLTGATPKSTLVTTLPEVEFGIGVTPFTGGNGTKVFLADAGKGSLYSVDMTTGKYEVLLTDPTMKAPASAFIQEGIHGLKYNFGYLYFTNTFGGTLNKIQIDTVTGKPVGSVVQVATGLNGPEDFSIAASGVAQVNVMSDGKVVKIDNTGKVTDLITAKGCTSNAVNWGLGDEGLLFIATTGGAVLSAPAPL